MSTPKTRRPAQASDEWLALDWLLTRIGSWTNARWDQHLRDRFGDVRTDEIIEALGYEKRPAGEAPVPSAPGIRPCVLDPEDQLPVGVAAQRLWGYLHDRGTPHLMGVGVQGNALVVYVGGARTKIAGQFPTIWYHYPVTTKRISGIMPAV